MLACADDLAITGRTLASLKENFSSFETTTKKMNLKVKQNKTKCMALNVPMYVMNQYAAYNFVIEQYKFELVKNFIHLVTLLNSGNNIK